jgi:NADH-quinone oxidoreductase subunit L
MIAALGVGAYAAAAFHLITHAFFKALLFLASGSVIHGMEHGEHVAHATHEAGDEHGHAAPARAAPAFDPQDMRNMGGLYRKMPVTAATFIIGGMALSGLPLVTAGFWSKDEIFADAVNMSAKTPVAIFVLVCLALAAILTAMYTMRQIGMTFFGSPRTEAALYALLNDGSSEGRKVSALLTGPLTVLAFLAIFAGFVGVNPDFPLFGPILNGLFDLRAPFGAFVGRTLLEPPLRLAFSGWPVLVSFTVFILGAWAGYMLYFRLPIVIGQPDPVKKIVGATLYRFPENKYYIDEFYVKFFINPARWAAERLVNQIIDRGIIDGILHGLAAMAIWIGNLFREFNRVVIDGVGDGIPAALADAARSLRQVQTGHIQQYLLYALIAFLWVGANLAVLAVKPEWIGIAAVIQVGAILVFVFVTGMGGAHTSSE